MSVTPRATVVIPVLNGEESLGDVLTGLASQAAIDGGFEVIVVDNGSTDRTVNIAEEHGATLLVELKRGPGAARDLGQRTASGEILCFLDADTFPTRRWVREMVAAFDDPSVVLAGGKTVSFPPESGAQRYMASSGRIDSQEYINRPLFPFTPSRNMAVRRSVALEIGWTSECITGEDVDFCHRVLARYPGPIAYRERAVLMHRNRATDEGLRRQAWSYGEGTAHLYQRYPEEVDWSWANTLEVRGKLIRRALAAGALSLGATLGACSRERGELARYHALWGRSFWHGFYSYRRTGEYR